MKRFLPHFLLFFAVLGNAQIVVDDSCTVKPLFEYLLANSTLTEFSKMNTVNTAKVEGRNNHADLFRDNYKVVSDIDTVHAISSGDMDEDSTFLACDLIDPNQYGYNTAWNIIGIAGGDPKAKIYIFDKFGKLLEQISRQGEGWDDKYNGYPLPASDYWFLVEYTEIGTRKFSNHFTLK